MRFLSLRRTLLAGGIAVLLAGSVIGLALAQQTPTPVPAPPTKATAARPGNQAFLDALARQLGITTDRLKEAMTEARKEVGTPKQGIKPRIEQTHKFGPAILNGSVAAQAIGISAAQLRQELPGKSLAQVAEAHGKNPADVATALKNAANQRIDLAATAGRLTAEKAAQQKQQVAQRIDQQMNQVVKQAAPRLRGQAPGPSVRQAPRR